MVPRLNNRYTSIYKNCLLGYRVYNAHSNLRQWGCKYYKTMQKTPLF